MPSKDSEGLRPFFSRDYNGIKRMTRKDVMPWGEVLEWIEDRRALVSDFLDKVTLSKLGDVPCIPDEAGWRPLSSNPGGNIVDFERRLKIQGVFSVRKHMISGNFVYVWGLSRAGKWLSVLARVEKTNKSVTDSEKFCPRWQAKELILDEDVDLPRLLNFVEHEEVLALLENFIIDAIQERKLLLKQLKRVAGIIKIESSTSKFVSRAEG